MRMEDLTPHEREFLNAYRAKPEKQEEVDKLLGTTIDIDAMDDDEFACYFADGLFMQAMDWMIESPDEILIPMPEKNAPMYKKLYAMGVNVCCYGFTKGLEMGLEAHKNAT